MFKTAWKSQSQSQFSIFLFYDNYWTMLLSSSYFMKRISFCPADLNNVSFHKLAIKHQSPYAICTMELKLFSYFQRRNVLRISTHTQKKREINLNFFFSAIKFYEDYKCKKTTHRMNLCKTYIKSNFFEFIPCRHHYELLISLCWGCGLLISQKGL